MPGQRLETSETSPFSDASGPSAAPLLVGQDHEGRWIVHDKGGLKYGMFATLKAALHFANEEAAAAGCHVELAAGLIDSGL